DTDAVIREKHRKSIVQIFASIGEEAFREQEHLALLEQRFATGVVLATGGGIVLQKRNIAVLRSLGIIIWLNAAEQIIWERVSRNRSRPLLQTANPRQTMRDLLTLRVPLYRSIADIIVETDHLSREQVTDRVFHELNSWLSSRRESRC
ncbi:MAG: shikimate kinase, partial [Verrucomicrobia bacterium]|nr:shikimate kinase [Verrucomicrobiota bacterium]